MSQQRLWWGYKHTNGSYQVKLFFSQEDLEDAYESPFCELVMKPFPANGRDEATKIVTDYFNNIK